MSLSAYQRTLARLYTDERARREFLKDPRRALRGGGLSSQERRSLAALAAARRARFCKGLRRKREEGG